MQEQEALAQALSRHTGNPEDQGDGQEDYIENTQDTLEQVGLLHGPPRHPSCPALPCLLPHLLPCPAHLYLLSMIEDLQLLQMLNLLRIVQNFCCGTPWKSRELNACFAQFYQACAVLETAASSDLCSSTFSRLALRLLCPHTLV